MAKKMSSKNKFSYEQAENIDAVFNYLSMVNKGLKNRHLSLGDDAQLLELALPEQVKLTIKAQVKSTKGSLGIELSWQMPEEELLPGGAVDQAATALTDDVKTQKKAEKKRLKAAEQALKLAEKNAAKAAKACKQTLAPFSADAVDILQTRNVSGFGALGTHPGDRETVCLVPNLCDQHQRGGSFAQD